MARLVASTSSAKEVRGLPAVVTRSPFAFSNGTIFDQLESSANAPCTSTTFFAEPAEFRCAIVAPPIEYDPTAYATAIVVMSVRIGPPVGSSPQVSRIPLERSNCFCRSGFELASGCPLGARLVCRVVCLVKTTHMPNVQPKRCAWVNVDNVLMREYHDREWGVPVHDDPRHFEFLILEAAQAGLSWSIVLNKREGYRRAFSDFNPEKVARYSAARIDKLTTDAGIIRNRMKIAAAVKNARAFLAVQEEHGSFDAYCWRFVDGRPRQNRWKTIRQIPATTRASDAFSRDLKRRGFSFVGSTVMDGHMQAVGMVNDHLMAFFRYCDVRRLGTSRKWSPTRGGSQKHK